MRETFTMPCIPQRFEIAFDIHCMNNTIKAEDYIVPLSGSQILSVLKGSEPFFLRQNTCMIVV